MQKRNLLLTMGLMLTMGATAQTSPWPGHAVEAGEFYLYNVESGLWLQNNDSKTHDWHTRGAIGTRGLDFTLAGSDGNYTIGAKFGQPSINPDNNYIDTGYNPAWTFEAVEKEGVTNAYKIYCGNKVLGTVKYDEQWKQDNLFTQKGDERWYLENPNFNIDMTERNTWQLVTKEERLAKMKAEASLDNPVDASWLIPSADLANNDTRYNLWTKTFDGGNNRRAGDEGNDNTRGSMCQESWNSNSFDFNITLSVPNGTYRFNLQGFYRDGNFDEVYTRRNDGTETIRAYYYANEVEHPLMSILDEAKTTSGVIGYEREKSGLWYPDQQTSANRCFMHNGYINEEIEVVVTTGQLKIGVRKASKAEADWTVFDNFHLTYLGNNIDVSALVEGLQTLIDEAEAYDTSNTTEALAQDLAAAVAAAKEVLTATDADVISDAMAALGTALNNARSVNVEILRQTIALAKGENLPTATAEDVAVNAKDQLAVDQALFDLRAARKINGLRLKDIYTGSKPAAGKVYLFNVGTGLFLGSGGDWNTHIAVDQRGIEIELRELDTPEENNFKMYTGLGNNDQGWLAYNGYVDTPAQDIWHFLPVEGKEGVYNISSTGQDGFLLGYDPNFNAGGKFWSTIAIDRTGLDNPMNQWKVITAAEREKLLAKANAAAPVEVSYLITNGSLIRQWGLGEQNNGIQNTWTIANSEGSTSARVSTNNNSNNSENFGWEFYNTDNFSFTQDLEGLKPGVYEVSVYAFYRDGDGGYQAGVLKDGGELLQTAFLVANDEQAPLVNITKYAGKVPGIGSQQSVNGAFPNWPGEALEFFEYGYYKNSVEVLVGEDGKLKLGIMKNEKLNDGDWVVLDNFRLVYKGQPTEAVTLPKTWNFSNWNAGTIYPSIEVDGLTAVVNDAERTMEIDAHARSVDGVDYTQRLKTGGTGAENNRVLTFLAPGNFNIEVVLTSANTSKERTLNIATGEFANVVATMTAAAGEVTKETCSVQAELEEPVYIYSDKDGINLYAIYLKEYDETVTGITEVAAERTDGNVYNLQGQKVQATKKGLYIVDGKKVIMK